jgi:hypothetical protein
VTPDDARKWLEKKVSWDPVRPSNSDVEIGTRSRFSHDSLDDSRHIWAGKAPPAAPFIEVLSSQDN